MIGNIQIRLFIYQIMDTVKEYSAVGLFFVNRNLLNKVIIYKLL